MRRNGQVSVTLKPCPRAFRIREQSANQIIQIIAGRPPSIALPFPFPSTIGFPAALIRPNFFFFFFTFFELLFSMIERSVARFVKEPMWRNNKSSIKSRIPGEEKSRIYIELAVRILEERSHLFAISPPLPGRVTGQ